MAFNAGFTYQGKLAMIRGEMNAGDQYMIALYNGSPAWADAQSITTLEYAVGNAGQSTATTGYTAGGQALASYASALYTGTATIDWGDIVWTVTGTLQADTAIIYNNTTATKTVLAIFSFTSTSATNSTFTITMPAAAAGTAVIRLA
jgi:hypothetical protein